MTELRAIDVVGYAKITPPSSFGASPKLDWIAIDKLVIDPAYQRDVFGEGRSNVRRIAAAFNWSKFGTVVVAPVGGGRYAIIDGQHRATAAALCGIDKVPCQIIAADRADQAAAFRAINGATTKLNSMQLHHAAVAAGDAEAKLVNTVCAKADCIILRYPKPWDIIAPGETMAVVAIRRAIKKFGDDTVATAMRAIRAAGDGNAGWLRTQTIYGSAEVLHDHPEWRDQGVALLEAFDAFDIAEAFAQSAAAAARTRGSSITDQFEAHLVDALSTFFAARDRARRRA